MKLPAEIVKEAKAQARQKKTTNEVIMRVADMVKQIQGCKLETISVPELEQLVFELSGYMFTLSAELATANIEYNSSYIYRKIRGATLYFEVEGQTVSERNSLAEKTNQHNYVNEAIANYYADVIKHLYKDCERMVNIIQSIMANRRNEAKNNIQT